MLQTILVMLCMIFIVLFTWLSYRLFSILMPNLHMHHRVRTYVQRYLYQEHYRLVENVCLTDNKGQKLVIPQTLVSRYGIFILGFCDARGRIIGNNSISWWYTHKGNKYYPFDNPHIQYDGLNLILANHIGISEKFCETIILFNERAKFNHSNYQKTGYLLDIFRYITSQRLGYLSLDEFHQLINKLERSQQNITSDAKRCIIETGVIEPRPVS